LRIERIVSTGQITPEGEWYDAEEAEFVLLVSGAARLRIEGEDEDRELGEGDYILLPPHCRHCVTFTRAAPRRRRSGSRCISLHKFQPCANFPRKPGLPNCPNFAAY
jgi:hypothetical protein